MSPTAVDCRGVTQTGNPCRNATTNPDGWCRRCAGVPAAVPAGAVDPLLAATTAATEPGGGGIKIVTTLSPETEKALASARYAATLHYPYLDRMLNSMPPVEAHGLGTVACDDTWRLYLDPAVFNHWTIEERTGALVHEVLHLLHEHGARGKRLPEGNVDHTTWNIASDSEINEDIIADSESGQTKGVALPDGCITPQVLRDKFPDREILDGETAEYYYRKIHECHCQCHNPQQGQQGQSGGDSGGGGQGQQGQQGQSGGGQGQQGQQGQSGGGQGQQGQQGQSGGGCGNCNCGSGQGQPGDGQGGGGQGQPGQPGQQGQSGGGQGSGPGQLGDGTCGGGSGIGKREDWELDPGEGPQGTNPVEQDMALDDAAVKIQSAVKSRGDVPGSMRRFAEKRLAKPQVSWQQQLRKTMRRALETRAGMSDYTYAKPSRRRIPGVILPGMREPKQNIAVIVDTSGSMSDGDIHAALSEIQGIAHQTGASGTSLRVLSVDAAASEPQEVHNVRDIKLKGGGGTDMRVGITAAAEMDPPPDVVVVLTDGYTPWPEKKNRAHDMIPVLIHEPGSEPPEPPAWAKAIHITPQPA